MDIAAMYQKYVQEHNVNLWERFSQMRIELWYVNDFTGVEEIVNTAFVKDANEIEEYCVNLHGVAKLYNQHCIVTSKGIEKIYDELVATKKFIGGVKYEQSNC